MGASDADGRRRRVDAAADSWTFSAVLAAAVVFMAVAALSLRYADPQADPLAGRTHAFVFAAGLHALVHGTGPALRARLGIVPYLVLQAVLVVTLGSLAGAVPLLAGLVIVFTADAVVAGGHRWRAGRIVAGGVALFAVAVPLTAGWSQTRGSLVLLVAIGLLIYVVNFARSVAARRRIGGLLEEVEASHRKLADYAGRVQTLSRDRERQRLARELHDTLAQDLVGLTLQLEAADSHLARSAVEQAREIIRGAMAHAREALDESRDAIHGLRAPRAFDRALRDEIDRFTEQCASTCVLEDDLRIAPPEPVASEALLILREALTNVARHAAAEQVHVLVRGDGDALEIRVEDDGVGFDGRVDPAGEHYGVQGLRERVAALGGRISFRGRADGGTEVRAVIPTDG